MAGRIVAAEARTADAALLGTLAGVGAFGHINWTTVTVHFFITLAVVGFHLHGFVSHKPRLARTHEDLTFFRKGSMSLADHPSAPQLSKSDRWALVYTIQLMEEPPPSVPPEGTIGARSASCGAF